MNYKDLNHINLTQLLLKLKRDELFLEYFIPNLKQKAKYKLRYIPENGYTSAPPLEENNIIDPDDGKGFNIMNDASVEYKNKMDDLLIDYHEYELKQVKEKITKIIEFIKTTW